MTTYFLYCLGAQMWLLAKCGLRVHVQISWKGACKTVKATTLPEPQYIPLLTFKEATR